MTQANTFNVDGVDAFVEGAGTETLLMIHGWPDTHRIWDSLVGHLRSRYVCARFTLPGYDLSKPARAMSLEQMLAFFGAVADRVSPNQAITLVVHDWGCIFGYEFAARYPQRVARIVGVVLARLVRRCCYAAYGAREECSSRPHRDSVANELSLRHAVVRRVRRAAHAGSSCAALPDVVRIRRMQREHVALARMAGHCRSEARQQVSQSSRRPLGHAGATGRFQRVR